MPNNSPLTRIPSIFDLEQPDGQMVPAPRASSTDSTPPRLASWFSSKIFRLVMFFIFCFCILGITTSLVFSDRMSIENYMNILSSLLFLLSPSPLDLIKSKKKRG